MRAVGAAFSVLGTTAQTVTTAIGGFFSALGATISGIIDGINSKIQAAMGAIDGLRAAAGAIGNIVSGAANAVASAGGAIPHFAGGTNYAPGGLAVVGEYGPELVNLPRGSEVFPNGQAPTSALRPASGGSGGNIYVTVTGNTILNDQDAARLATIIGRHLVQQTGAAYSLAGLGGR
jgi:phage-related tail protein